jgi:hypothetical protein
MIHFYGLGKVIAPQQTFVHFAIHFEILMTECTVPCRRLTDFVRLFRLMGGLVISRADCRAISARRRTTAHFTSSARFYVLAML